MSYCFGDIGVCSQRILLNSCWVSIFYLYLLLILHKWWLRPLKTTSFSERVKWEFSNEYIGWTDLCFLFTSAQNCKKALFWTTQGPCSRKHGKKKRWKLDKWPIVWSTFSALTVCNIHFCIWKLSKFIFIWSSILSTLACKTPPLGQEQPI